MAALQCEICGGKLIGKPGGVFECDSCGMEYSTEWAKAKIQEIKGTVKVEGTVEVTGKVQVEGGTVQVEGTANAESLLKRAKMCYEEHDWEMAGNLLEQVLNADPECGEAYLYRAAIRYECDTLDALKEKYCDVVHFSKMAEDFDLVKALRFFTGGQLEQWSYQRSLAVSQDEASREASIPKLEEQRKKCAAARKMIGYGSNYIVGVNADGTVKYTGDLEDFRLRSISDAVSEWNGIDAVACSEMHMAGLRQGSVVIAGCYGSPAGLNESERAIDVACGPQYSASGWDRNGYTVAIRPDGTVCTEGFRYKDDLADWKDISAVACSAYHIVGLKRDGTVLSAGDGLAGKTNVGGWNDIVEVACSNCHTVGLRRDGTVVAVGDNGQGQCDVSAWRDIVAVACDSENTVGVTLDGTVLSTSRIKGFINGLIKRNLGSWKDIVAVACGGGSLHVVGLQCDGTLVFDGVGVYHEGDVKDWKLFNSIDTLEEERAAARRAAEERRIAEEKAAEEARLAAEKARQARIAKLEAEKSALNTELANLKGMFSGKRRKEIEARLVQIDAELKKLK